MTCRRCKRTGREHKARALCPSCWNHVAKYRRDELADYPRTSMSRADFVEEYRFLWEAGYRFDENIAAKLGMRVDTMRTARRRAIKAGVSLPLVTTPQTEYTS